MKQEADFKSNADDFTYPAAEHALEYTSLSDYDTKGTSMEKLA